VHWPADEGLEDEKGQGALKKVIFGLEHGVPIDSYRYRRLTGQNVSREGRKIEDTRTPCLGKPVDIITLYYWDGDRIKLTHYCMSGNQPTMRGTYSPETKTLKFDLESITNLKSADSGHMHHATYTFIDSDHFKTTWTLRKDQKDAFTEDVTYVRK
jgi:hypothetical protein